MKKNLEKNDINFKAFKWFHATSGSGGAMLIAAIQATFFSVFMTDTMNIPTKVCSLIMLIATLWDAINDPIMGVIADRTHTKWGRYRPYFIPAPILLTIFATLLWLNPSFSVKGKVIWVLIMYIGYGMTVTMYTMPQTAILPACIKDNDKRNEVISLGAGISALAFTVGTSFTENVKAFFENTLHFQNGYIPIMLCCGVMALISFWGLFSTSKEKYVVKTEKVSVKDSLGKVLKHTELYPIILVWVVASVGYGLNFSSTIYYLTYYLGRPDLISKYMLITSVGGLLSMFVIMPYLLKKLHSGHKALIVSQVVSIICYGILFFVGKYNLIIFFVLSVFAGMFSTMQNALVNVLVNDAIDYLQWKDNISANGVISSIKGFAQKCGNTITSSGLLFVLGMAGYVSGDIAGQPASAKFAINFMRFGAPVILGLIIIIALRFNPAEKHKKEIEEMKSKEL